MKRRPVVKKPEEKPVVGAEVMVSPRDAVDLAEYNPRTQTTESADRLRNSLAAFGLADLPVVNRRSMAKGWPKGSRPCLVGGHQRLRILDARHGQAYQFRHTVVDLDAPMEKALNVALNNQSMAGTYDDAKLAPILFELQAVEGFNVEMTGFTVPEVTGLCVDTGLMEAPMVTEDEAPIDRAKELQKKWGTKRGHVWECGRHRVMCGDSTNAEDMKKLMGGDVADMVFTDPPYGINIVAKNGKIGGENWAEPATYSPVVNDDTTDTARKFHELCVSLKIKGHIIWGGNYFTGFLPPRSCWLIWDKREGMTSNNFADCEIAWTSFSKPSRIYRHLWAGAIRKGHDGKRVHPTQKPVALHASILNDFTEKDAVIFDGFLGSGTTMIAAEQTGRIARGMEIDPGYTAVVLERFATLTGQTPKRISP